MLLLSFLTLFIWFPVYHFNKMNENIMELLILSQMHIFTLINYMQINNSHSILYIHRILCVLVKITKQKQNGIHKYSVPCTQNACTHLYLQALLILHGGKQYSWHSQFNFLYWQIQKEEESYSQIFEQKLQLKVFVGITGLNFHYAKDRVVWRNENMHCVKIQISICK